MNIKYAGATIAMFFCGAICLGQRKNGAVIPWMTIEAEHMHTSGTVMGPRYDPYQVETESSGQRCVKLAANGQFVEFSAPVTANCMVIRYSLPDGMEGNGRSATFGLYKNGELIRQCRLTSRYSRLYGKYPFSNDPAAGEPRNFYDEVRIKGLNIGKGDVIRIQRDDRDGDDAQYCIIDLADLENIAPPLPRPPNSWSVTDKRFQNDASDGGTSIDNTEAIKRCVALATETGKTVWIPAGEYRITGDIVLPSNVTIQGAGMWYTELVGDEAAYADANKRVRLKGNGDNIHISDFAIVGRLNYRSDKEDNDGVVGSFGTNSTISRIWIEHTKVGMWIENSKGLRITGCRMRNTIADGINFCVGMAGSTIEDCTARGTGDDCYAIWPTIFKPQQFAPGHNLIVHCTAQLPFLANGAAIYGGESNAIRNCNFTDISQGSAILLSTTFPTETKDKRIDNNFSGTTVVSNCDIRTSGGFDHEWDWRAAVEICLDKRNISGIEISDLNIDSSLSNGISVVAKNEPGKAGILSNASLEKVSIGSYGIGVRGKHALFVSPGAHGSLMIRQSAISDVGNGSTDFRILQ